MTIVRSMVSADLKNVRRDPLLGWVSILPFFLALLYRLVPLLRDALLARFGFDLEPYYVLIASSYVPAGPGVVGMVIGFLLIDERDDGVLTAIAVTPVAPSTYIGYRLAAPLLVATLATVVAYPLIGLAPLPLVDLLAIAAVAALLAPFTALFLAAFAANKVSAFAMVKILNTLGVAPVVAWFVPERWQWIAGILPQYWSMKMVWLASAGRGYGWAAVGGVVVSLVWMVVLLRVFRSRTG